MLMNDPTQTRFGHASPESLDHRRRMEAIADGAELDDENTLRGHLRGDTPIRCIERAARSRLLVVAPHPDDEIAIAGWLSARTGPVRICWMHATPRREAEARAAARLLGFDDLAFGPGRDGHFLDQWVELRNWTESQMLDFQPDFVLVPAFEQGHLDHDAAHWIARQVFGNPVLEFPLYHPYTRRWQRVGELADSEIFRLSPDQRRLKRRLLGVYGSQTVLRNYRLLRLARVLSSGMHPLAEERLRLATGGSPSAPSHTGALGAEIEASAAWARWRAAALPSL